jgi:hypothetical protein
VQLTSSQPQSAQVQTSQHEQGAAGAVSASAVPNDLTIPNAAAASTPPTTNKDLIIWKDSQEKWKTNFNRKLQAQRRH